MTSTCMPDFACGVKGGGGPDRGMVPGAGLSRLIRASIDSKGSTIPTGCIWERRGGIVPAPHQGTTFVRGARVQDRNVARVHPTITHSPRRFNSPSHKRRSSRWYFYYRERAIEGRATTFRPKASGIRRVEAETETHKNTERTPLVDQTVRFKITEKH